MNIAKLRIYIYIKRLNLIRTKCKPFGLHQPIRTYHIKFLLKLIVKSIHPNTLNNILSNKKTKPISHFPKISIPLQLLRLHQSVMSNFTFTMMSDTSQGVYKEFDT